MALSEDSRLQSGMGKGDRLPLLGPYRHAERAAERRNEAYEPSEEERHTISSIKVGPSPLRMSDVPHRPTKIIIDTDIGTDFDDTMALLYALHVKEAEISGVTTNDGPTDLRVDLTRLLVEAFRATHPGLREFPIVAGASQQLGTHREVYNGGHEGLPFFPEERVAKLDPKHWPTLSQTDAADFMIREALKAPGEVMIISIGIPTNIALAIQREPRFAGSVREIVVMGGGRIVTSCSIKPGLKIPEPVPEGSPGEVSKWVASGRSYFLATTWAVTQPRRA
jgi:hypothetical protein